MYAEVGGSWVAGAVVVVVVAVVVVVSGEAFCRTAGGLCLETLVKELYTKFGILGFAGKIDKTGANVDLSIVAMVIIIDVKPRAWMMEVGTTSAAKTNKLFYFASFFYPSQSAVLPLLTLLGLRVSVYDHPPFLKYIMDIQSIVQ